MIESFRNKKILVVVAHPRSPKSLEIISKRWGTVIGVEYAEAFCIIRALAS